MTPPGTAYDITPYPDLAYGQTHPGRLAVMGRLYGIDPASVATCRLLEIGCAAGGNLLPMAAALPQAAFVGIDASARQIADGETRRARLGLDNVRLLALDIQALSNEPVDFLGSFDYIVAHGVYSWVTQEVREALLAVCGERLRPQGIAYVSYNTYPGWRAASVIRDLMRYRTRAVAAPQAQAQAARAIVQQIAKMIPAETGGYAELFRRYSQVMVSGLKGVEDGFLLHDELEATNDPVYFHEFVEHAARHGLRYLGETQVRDTAQYGLPAEMLAQIEAVAQDGIEVEQYADFVCNRMFRQTLLCPIGCRSQVAMDVATLAELWVRSRAQPVAPDEGRVPDGFVQFRSEDGMTLTTGHTVTGAAMGLLQDAWPQAVHFGGLLERAQGVAGICASEDGAVLAANLLRGFGYSSRLIDLHTHPAPCVASPGEWPVAWPVARLEAETRNVVTNVWHERVRLTTEQCRLLALLDGTRSRDNLRQAVAGSWSGLSSDDWQHGLHWLAQAGLMTA